MSDGKLGRIGGLVSRRLRRASPLFILCVLIPTTLATIYYGLIASDVYISESRYIVRTQGKQATTGLASLLAGSDLGGFSGNAMSALGDYALSRDAMNALNEKGQLEHIYSRPGIDAFDRLSLFGGRTSKEHLFEYFTNHVDLNSDNQTAIAKMMVRAYRPEDARWINEQLLELGEGLVNRLNSRSQADLVRYSKQEVERTKEEARRASLALAEYRNNHAVIDPEKQATISLQAISKLQDEMIQTKTQLIQLRAYTPQNPQIPILQTREQSLDNEIHNEMQKIAGGKGSLAAQTAEYTRLSLEAEFAGKLLANALLSLQNANNDALRQQVYVERIVQPNLPDKAMQPRRLRGIFSVFVLGLVAWGLLTMLVSALREHNL